MKCTIVNRNYPPSKGITGDSANELAGFLISKGVEVHVVTVDSKYQGGGTITTEVNGTVRSISTLYNGKNKLLRLFSSQLEGWRLARKALAIDGGPILAMTDPPLLNFWLARKAHQKSRPWIYWSMDLYPEAFHASGLSSKTNPVYRYLASTLQKRPPQALLALGPQQANFIAKGYSDSIETILLPCGITGSKPPETKPEWFKEDGKTLIAYIGNVGEAHDPEFINKAIEAIDPNKQRFVLCAYGSNASKVLDFAKGRKGVHIVSHVERRHLQLIDIHVVSLLPKWDHICVPSKAVSAVCEGCGILIACSEENDNWTLLKNAAHRIPTEGNPLAAIQDFYATLTPQRIQEIREQAKSTSESLLIMKEAAFNQIFEQIKKLN